MKIVKQYNQTQANEDTVPFCHFRNEKFREYCLGRTYEIIKINIKNSVILFSLISQTKAGFLVS